MAYSHRRRSARSAAEPLLLLALALSAGSGFAPPALPATASSQVVVRPAPAPAPARPGSGSPYLTAARVDIVQLLPPPPAADSPAQQAELQAVLEAQRTARDAGTLGHALADVEQNCGRFADVLGEALTSQRSANVLQFLNRAAREGGSIVGPAKRYWKRTRPYAFSGEVQALGDMSPERKARPAMSGNTANTARQDPPAQDKSANVLAHSSYPSGHATFGTVCTILLATMVPERREALFARGRDYAHSRMVLGAHFPTDLEAGRIAGTLAVQLLLQDRAFRRDLAAAQSNLRAALGLPAALPDLEPQAIDSESTH